MKQLSSNRQMINIEDRLFNINRMLLLIVGLWPYQKSKLVEFQFICFFSVLISIIMFQFTTFLTSKCTKDLIIQVFSVASCLMAFAIMYKAFYDNGEIIKSLIEQLQHICANLRDNEITIIEKYSNYGKRYTITFTVVFVCSASIVVCAHLWPDFVDMILPKNESRPRQLPVITEYFVDQEQYFYFLFLHILAAIAIALFSFMATTTMFTAYFIHVCGMFEIASYRIEHTMKIYVLHIHLQRDKLLYEGIICAVDIHRKAMQFAEDLISCFEITFMFLIVLAVITLSLNFFRVIYIVSSAYSTQDLLTSFLIGFLCILSLFLANYIGQEIIDHYNHIFITVYQVQWYTAPVYVQKMLLFILQKGSKTFGLSVGGLFTGSLQCFSSLVNTSISYFTVMYSVQ